MRYQSTTTGPLALSTSLSHLPRFDHSRPLTEDELHAHAPSVFATEPHSSRSERFRVIPTIEVIRRLAGEGFSVVGAKQGGCRTPDRQPFTKHVLRLRRFDDTQMYKVGDTIFEIILKNGNDGSASYDLLAALFKILCLNGMVADVGQHDAHRVRHTGDDVIPRVIEGSFEVLKQAERALEAPRVWSGLELDNDERTAFAHAVHTLRFTNPDGNVTTAIKPEQLLEPRRYQDNGRNLWTTYNVAQENVIRGGLTAEGRDAANRRRRYTSRAINGVDDDIRLNRALFVLADQLAVLKGASPLVPQREAA